MPTARSNAAPRPSRRRVGRPTTQVLTQDRMTESALRILTDEGYDALTMTRLAGALRVTPAALYNHAASKREILLWVQDRIMGDIDVSAFASADHDWFTALVQWAVSYRDVMSRYVPLIAPIAVMPITGSPDTMRMYESVAAGLARGGWPSRTIVPTIVAIESFIYGSAYDTQAPDDIFDTGDDAASTPVFTEAVRAHCSAYRGNDVANVAFEIGLEALIAGIARRAGIDVPVRLSEPGTLAVGQVAGLAVTPDGAVAPGGAGAGAGAGAAEAGGAGAAGAGAAGAGAGVAGAAVAGAGVAGTGAGAAAGAGVTDGSDEAEQPGA